MRSRGRRARGLIAVAVALFLPASAAAQVSLSPLPLPGGNQPIKNLTHTARQTVTTVENTANRAVSGAESGVNGVVDGLGGGSGGSGSPGSTSPNPPSSAPPAGANPPASTAPEAGGPSVGGAASPSGGSASPAGRSAQGGAAPRNAAPAAAGASAPALGGGPRRGPAHRAAPRPATTQTAGIIHDIASLPWSFFAACVGIAILGVLMAGRSAFLARLSRRLRRQGDELREDVGALQQALLPGVPSRLGAVDISVAYRPAEGPAAGGDFYDAVRIDERRIGIVVGDMSGHGRDALTATALVHYTLRAYLEAGLSPGAALRQADRALGNKLGEEFATVVTAVYDSSESTLTYSCAGHPAPLLFGSAQDRAVETLNPPPIAAGPPTGWRETTVAVKSGTRIAFITDGLIEARDSEGALVGRAGLASILADLPPLADAGQILDFVKNHGNAPDDLTVCVLDPTDARRDGSIVEELDLSGSQALRDSFGDFLAQCGLDHDEEMHAVAQLARVSRPPRPGLRLTIRRDDGGSTWEMDYERPDVRRAPVQTLPRPLQRAG